MATPLFVMGKHRSGTTLLGNLLLSHPDIAGAHYPPDSDVSKLGVHDSGYFDRIVGRYGDIGNFESYVEFASVVSRSEYFVLCGCGFEELMGYYPANYYEVFRHVMDKFASGAGVSYWMEKAPPNAIHAEDIKWHIPDAKFIGVMRDEVDVVLSSLHLKQKQGKSRLVRLKILAGVVFLKYVYDMSMKRLKGAHPEDVLILQFDRLVNDREEASRQICDFLGLENRQLETQYVKNTSFKNISEKKSYSYERLIVRVLYQYIFRTVPYCLLKVICRIFFRKREPLPGWFFRNVKQQMKG
jgi:hypothetical protein